MGIARGRGLLRGREDGQVLEKEFPNEDGQGVSGMDRGVVCMDGADDWQGDGNGEDEDEDVNDGAIAGEDGGAAGEDGEPVAVDDDGWCELGAFNDECMADGEIGEAAANPFNPFEQSILVIW